MGPKGVEGPEGPIGPAGQVPNITIVTVDGAEAGVSIEVSGIAEGGVVNVTVLDNDAGTATDLTSEASVPAEGSIQLSDTDTTGKSLLVFWIAPHAAAH